jgi:pimeloyl-ACP methyl ester carboxylesterase
MERRGTAPADGGEIAYFVTGDGPPVAATHPYVMPRSGYGASGYGGVPGCTTVTVWPRGFTGSSTPRDAGDNWLERVADDVDAVRRSLGYERWAFWGVSMGGFVGLYYALRHQDKLTALVLDSTAPSYHYALDPDSIWPKLRMTQESKEWTERPSAGTMSPYFTKMWEAMGVPDPVAMQTDWLRRMEFNADALAAILRRMGEFDLRARLGEIRVPTLVLAGGLDRGCLPKESRTIADGIPGAVLRVFDRTGHGVLNQRPAGVEDLVREFIQRNAGVAAG